MNEQAKTLCIYHGNCADGFTAAWVVEQARKAGKIEGEIEYVPATYGSIPPDYHGKDLIIVDFSYPRHIMQSLILEANSMLVLDHHKTAEKELEGLNLISGNREFTPTYMEPAKGDGQYRCLCCFDMKRSGAGLAWDYFFPKETRPLLVDHVEDRDLWLFKIPGTREIQANIFSYEYTFKNWDKLEEEINFSDIPTYEGAAIERKHHKDIAELLAVCQMERLIGGFTVPCANLPYTLASDACHKLLQDNPKAAFAATYFINGGGEAVFSLRSEDSREDVSVIAKSYGGGGHRNAAGFTIPWDKLGFFGVFTNYGPFPDEAPL